VTLSEEVYGGGAEIAFFGSTNGMVYQMDKGTSFDGADIEWYAEFVFNNAKSYRLLKRYRHLTFELTGTGYAEFSSNYLLSYGNADPAQSDVTVHTVSLENGVWDDGGYWDDGGVWDGTSLDTISDAITGIGYNMSLKLQGNGDYFTPLKFSGAFIEFTPLRAIR